MIVVLATARDQIGDYLQAVIYVYTLIIFAYVLTSLIFSLGVRVPYARWSDALLSFLRDVSEPYLRIFRRFLPMLGPIDISPIVGILVLQIVGGILVNIVRG